MLGYFEKEGVSYSCPSVLYTFIPVHLPPEAAFVREQTLISINRTPVLDLVDYQYLTARPSLEMLLEDESGTQHVVHIHKLTEESLGLTLDTLADELPEDLRQSLHVLFH